MLKLYELKEKTPCIVEMDGACGDFDSREQAVEYAKMIALGATVTVYAYAGKPATVFWLCHPGQEGWFVDPTTGPDWMERGHPPL